MEHEKPRRIQGNLRREDHCCLSMGIAMDHGLHHRQAVVFTTSAYSIVALAGSSWILLDYGIGHSMVVLVVFDFAKFFDT